MTEVIAFSIAFLFKNIYTASTHPNWRLVEVLKKMITDLWAGDRQALTEDAMY